MSGERSNAETVPHQYPRAEKNSGKGIVLRSPEDGHHLNAVPGLSSRVSAAEADRYLPVRRSGPVLPAKGTDR